MSDENGVKPRRAGTARDWPVAVIALGGLLVAVGMFSEGPATPLGWSLMVFGVVALLIRSGSITLRR